MKLSHYAILFVIFALGVAAVTDMRVAEKKYLNRQFEIMDGYLDRAVKAGANELRASGTVFDEAAEYRAIEAFFLSMYASMGIMDMPEQRRMLVKYVPELIIMLEDGYYVYTPEETVSTDAVPAGYKRSEFVNSKGEIAFAAYIKGFPMETEHYDGYGLSVFGITEKEYS